MALTYGFYNSKDHDRLYSAEEMSCFLDGIVDDGVYAAIGDKFFVEPYNGMDISVGTGRAWFDHTWTSNTTKIILTVPDPDPIYTRIDAVVLEVNKADRRNYIKIVKGEPASGPQPPYMVKQVLIKQWPLAYIRVPPVDTFDSIGPEHITYMVDTSETPLCSAINLAGIPSGGETGMVLAKESSESGAVGWHHVTNLPKDDWWRPGGWANDDNVLAAYLFGNVSGQSRAVKNLAGNTQDDRFTLLPTNNPLWNNLKGFRVNGNECLRNEYLEGMYEQISTTIVCYTDVSTTQGTMSCYLSCPNYNSRLVAARFIHNSGPGFSDTNVYTDGVSQVYHYGSLLDQGVIGCDFVDNLLYFNGSLVETAVQTDLDKVYANMNAIVGSRQFSEDHYTSGFVFAIAFYKTKLTAVEHADVANSLRVMRGL